MSHASSGTRQCGAPCPGGSEPSGAEHGLCRNLVTPPEARCYRHRCAPRIHRWPLLTPGVIGCFCGAREIDYEPGRPPLPRLVAPVSSPTLSSPPTYTTEEPSSHE